ncbi:traB domain-containing protein-like isoform X2 [Punica granatum]|uniref:TraB domain-containing protein-like isoform X2 n=1 Tax=Punica granatum TaxID=22663 RepID=A0A6P8CLJ8_PUNGR|nr:traB domain-containing protein-like isoform X2 [Punica granatum]
MNRLIRRVKPLSSILSTRSPSHSPLLPKPPPPLPHFRPRLSYSGPKSASFPLPGVPVGRRRTDPWPSSMDPHAPEPDPAAADYYVHIEDPNPNVESLSESFVGVDDARSEDDAVPRGGESEGLESLDRGRTLPEELSRNVMFLSCESSAKGGTCDVYVVGTCHVSQKSCREVQAIISYLKPEVVFLELCSQRVGVLTPRNLKVPTVGEMIEMWKKKQNLFGILYSRFLANVASKLKVLPGAEFRVAYEEAMKYGGRVILGDRPVQLKKMDDAGLMILAIQELSKEFPTLMETLLHERDQYMSCKLLKIASKHSSVVAVVGKAHMNGIKKHWKQPVNMIDLLVIP